MLSRAVFAIIVVSTAAVFSLKPSPAAAISAGPYLALGDSIAFGFNPTANYLDPKTFVGYPDIVAAIIGARPINASCPGETSGSMITKGAPDQGCGLFRFFFPLHVAYANSQLTLAVDFLKQNPNTSLVTIDIGVNDLFLLLKFCGNNDQCIQAAFPWVLQQFSQHLDVILGAIRDQAGYGGRIIALTYYSLNYSDRTLDLLTQSLNTVVMSRTVSRGGRVADGFAAFQKAAAPFAGDTCAAGLRIVLSPGSCDIHPSPKGRDLLAHAVVDVSMSRRQ